MRTHLTVRVKSVRYDNHDTADTTTPVEIVKSVDMLINGDTEIVQEIIKSIPSKYEIS
jgi:hypothetical protein